jgi:2-polyprenyl-3-methyl-5-hydroxy-6-metoxy-1,4-benzoquinol methylase
MKSCYLCGSSSFTQRPGTVRDRKNLSVLSCDNCGLVFLSSFDHICGNFYEESGMHDGNVDLRSWRIETEIDDERRYLFLRQAIQNKRLLDFGCGNGGFLLKAKQTAATITGVELEKRFYSDFATEGVGVYPDIQQTPGKYDVITLFHTLEHIPDPISLLGNLTTKLEYGGKIFVEVPNADDALLSLYKCDGFQNFTYWSCHLFLFNQYTLKMLGKKAGLQVECVKQIQRYPLTNHLYWLAQNSPGGHKFWSFLDTKTLHDAYEKQLASIGACDTLLACFTK